MTKTLFKIILIFIIMGFVFPKEILKLILMRVLELEYSERKKKTKILKLFNNYLLKFKVNKHHRRIWVTIPENKRVIHFSEIYINKYRKRTGNDFPINSDILYKYGEEIVKNRGL